MAKKKMNLKAGARKVASRAKKAAGKLDIVSILKANAGGLGAAFAVDKLDDIEAVAEMGPFAAPAIVEAGAIVLAMSGNKDLEPVAYGMMGGAAALMYGPIMEATGMDEPVNGTNTIDASKRVKSLLKGVIQRAGGRQMLPAAVPVQRPRPAVMPQKQQRPNQWAPGQQYGSWRRFSSMDEC